MEHQQHAAAAAPELQRNAALSRYEARVHGQVAGFAAYREQDGVVRFTHTEVQPAFEGQGLGSRLAAYALDDVKARGLKASPLCPFIAKYLQRHAQDYPDLLAA